MKYLLPIVLFCVGTVPCYAASAEEIIGKTVTNYDNMTTLYLEFSNVLCDEALGTCNITDGVIYFRKPSLFRLETEHPQRTYVGDSEFLWIYLPDEERVIKQNMTELPFQVNPDYFLRDYDERFVATLVEENEQTCQIDLTPKDSMDLYEKITVKIDKEHFTITGIAVFDEVGSENKYDFHKIEINQKISQKQFEFKPPSGVRIDEY
jgi:chaperone LolA